MNSFCPRIEAKTKNKNKGLHQKLNSICPRNHVKIKDPNINQRSDSDHSPIIEEDADVDHSQVIGGIYPLPPPPPPPRVSAPLDTTV